MRKFAFACILLLALLVTSAPVLSQDNPQPYPVQEIPLPNLPVYTLKMAPTGDLLALFVGSEPLILLNVPRLEYRVNPFFMPIRLIDPETGEEVLRLRGGTDYIVDVAFTSTGDLLASYHRNGDVNLWDVTTGELIRTVETLPMGSRGIVFMPDDITLMITFNMGGLPAHFLLLDTESGAIPRIVRERFDSFGEVGISDYAQQAHNLFAAWSLSPDATLLALATQNGEVKLWDVATLEETIVLPLPEEYNPANFNVRGLAFSADGSTLIYHNREDESIHFWDIASETETSVLPLGERIFAVSPDMRQIAWATRHDVWLTDVDTPENAQPILEFADHLLSIATVNFTPDGSRLIVGGFGVDGALNDTGVFVGEEDNLLYIIDLE